MDCPNCQQKIPFFSKAIHSWGKIKTCPHCASPMRQDFAYGKFFTLAFAVGLPITLLGVFIPALAFLKSSLATGLIMGVLIMFCMRFKQVEP